MAVLSDLLGFPHHTCARGSKVQRSFLEDLARALEVPSPERVRTKEQLLTLAAQKATGGDFKVDLIISPGGQGTVKNEALDVLIDGVRAHGLAKAVGGGVAARIAANLEAAQRADADQAFGALDLCEERRASLRQVTLPSQSRFRAAVVAAYPGCAMTGCLTEAVLDAAHIRPGRGRGTNATTNGICLRADLRRLWDRGLLAVHERTHQVLVHPQVTDTAYLALVPTQIALPTDPRHWPNAESLRLQREWCDL
jgi:hypothetical protein